jgi:hypothetical protein
MERRTYDEEATASASRRSVTGESMSRVRGLAWLIAGVITGIATSTAAVTLVIGGARPAGGELGAPRFVEEANAAGIVHRYDGGFPFFVGGGVAVFDCDDDGMPDVYLAGGENEAALYRNVSAAASALRFERVSSAETDLVDVAGVYPIDVDSDGQTDLAVLRVGENVMLRGTGGCRFEPANDEWGIDGGNLWTAAFSAKWEGSASLPTLAFGNYAGLDETRRRAVGCSDNSLVRPAGAVYAAPIPLAPGYCTLSILFSDWDRSGRVDLRMTNDRHYYTGGEEQLWRVAAGETPRRYTEEEGWQPMQIWGMGIASQDLTGDGLPEVFLTSQGDNRLQTLSVGPGRPEYQDIAFERAATAHRPFTGGDVLPSTAWHAEFEDVNNDGLMDLFVSKGNVDSMTEYAANDPSNLLLGRSDGTFVEGAEDAGIVSFARGRGAAVVDLNLDGLLDIVEVNRRAGVKLWRNVGAGTGDAPVPMGEWLALRLRQSGPNGDAIGSWIEVRTEAATIEHEVTIGGGHAGGQLGWQHFGLGAARAAEVRVTWPDGTRGSWQPVASGGFYTVAPGESPVPFVPAG